VVIPEGGTTPIGLVTESVRQERQQVRQKQNPGNPKDCRDFYLVTGQDLNL
jgi:hypothetical protein